MILMKKKGEWITKCTTTGGKVKEEHELVWLVCCKPNVNKKYTLEQ
jgi:hypothetical protein